MGKLFALLLTLLSAAFPAVSHASRVSPMIVDLKPTGRDAIARVHLTNDGANDIAYEVQMVRGEISPSGELSLTPADDQFLVFPAQAIVEAESQQVFRVQYVGESALARSEIYYMSIRQIPVEFEEGVSQVQVVVNFNVLTNVVPDGAAAGPVIRSVRSIALDPVDVGTDDASPSEGDDDSEEAFSGLEIDVGNEGNRYFLAGMSTWDIAGQTTEGQPFELRLEREQLAKMIGVGVVGPGKNRIFRIPLDTPLADGSTTVTIEP